MQQQETAKPGTSENEATKSPQEIDPKVKEASELVKSYFEDFVTFMDGLFYDILEGNSIDIQFIVSLNTVFKRAGESEILNTFKESDYFKKISKHKEAMEIGSFKIEGEVTNDLNSFRLLTKVHTIKGGFNINFTNRTNPKVHLYYDPVIFTTVFSTDLSQLYLSHPMKNSGNSNYDAALRFHSELVSCFYRFHMKHDFRNSRVIDISRVRSIDPLTRMRIRETCLDDPQLKKKYFNSTFDLKEFVYLIYENYFPNVTWRYIGGDMFIGLYILQVTRYMFDLGLWDINDVYKIARVLLEKSINLKTLEAACYKDSIGSLKDNTSFIQKLRFFFSDIKINMTQILLHIILLVNDNSMKENLKWPKCELNDIRWNDSFIKNNEVYTIVSNILFSFILANSKMALDEDSDNTEEKNYLHLPIDQRNWDEKPQDYYIDMLLFIISDNETDLFIESNALITKELFNYYVTPKSTFKELEKEALEIRLEFIAMIDDIRKGEFGEIKELAACHQQRSNPNLSEEFQIVLSKIIAVENGIAYLLKWIYNFVHRSELTTIDKKFNAQMLLIEKNILSLILFLYGITESFISLETKTYICLGLKTICTDNKAGQAQLFIGDASYFYIRFNTESSFLTNILNRMIFKENNTIFYVNDDLFNLNYEFYKKLIQKIVPSNFEAQPILELQDVYIPLILSLYSYNIYLADIIDMEGVNTEGRVNKRFDLRMQEALVEMVEPIFTKILNRGMNEGSPWLEFINFKIMDQPTPIMLQMAAKRDYNLREINEMLCELSYSFLRLANACHYRYYYHFSYKQFKKHVSIEKAPEYVHLTQTNEGMVIKTEILKLQNKILIFPNNHLLNNRESELKKAGKAYQEQKINPVLYSPSMTTFLNEEINQLKQIQDLCVKSDSLNIKDAQNQEDETQLWVLRTAKGYVLEGLFPIIYKLMIGIKSNLYVDDITGLKVTELTTLLDFVEGIVIKLKHSTPIIQEICSDRKFNIYQEDIDTIKKVTEDNILYVEDAEEDELINFKLYHIRKLIDVILFAIKGSYSESHVDILRFYRRRTALIRDNTLKDKKVPIKERALENDLQQFKTLREEDRHRMTLSFERKTIKVEDRHSIFKTEYKIFNKHQNEYIALKKALLSSLNEEKNLLLHYFKKNKAALNLIITSVIKKLHRPLKQASTANLELQAIKDIMNDTEAKKYVLDAVSKLEKDYKEETDELKKENILKKLLHMSTLKRVSMSDEIYKWKEERAKQTSIIEFINHKIAISYLKFICQLITYDIASFKQFLYSILVDDERADVDVCKQGEEMINEETAAELEADKIRKNEQTKKEEDAKDKHEEEVNNWRTDIKNHYNDKGEFIANFENIKEKPIFLFKKEETLKEIYKACVILFIDFTEEFWTFCKYKTFQDSYHQEIWDLVLIFFVFFKNLCENRAAYFKKELSFIKRESKNRDIVFDFYVITESFLGESNDWYNDEGRLIMSDSPEILYSKIKMVELMTEFVNGPCPYNQRRIYKYRTDFFIGYLYRIIDDVSNDSIFYRFKESILDYLNGLIEGEGEAELDADAKKISEDPFLVTIYFSKNININHMISCYYKMTKKLYICRKMNLSKSYKKMIERLVEKNRTEKIKQLYKLKDPYSKEKEGVILRNSRIIPHYFETDKNCIITEEMMEVAPPISFDDLFYLYKTDKGFSGHPITLLFSRIYVFLEALAAKNMNFKMYLDSKKATIDRYFPGVISINQERGDGDEEPSPGEAFDSNLINEELMFLMLILKITSRVEVSSYSGKPVYLYFPLQPETFFLENETKETLFKELDLDNQRPHFQKHFKAYFIEMENNYKLNIRSPLTNFILSADNLFYQKWGAWVLGLAINIILLYSLKLNDNVVLGDRRLDGGIYDSIIFGISIAFGVYSGILFLNWLIFKFPLERRVQVEFFKLKYAFEDERSWLNSIFITFYYTILKDNGMINFFLHSAFSLLGVVGDPVFYTLHLLLIVNISATAKYVIKATMAHIDQLLLTFILAVFIIYSYSMITANYYSATFDSMSVGDLDVCESLLSCFLYVTNLGLRNGGGIADAQELYPIEASRFSGKMIFDISFFVLVNVISLNIIFGIIIDTFSEMRDADEYRHNALKNKCIICENSREAFEERKKKFENHISNEHILWSYPFYIKYLESKFTRSGKIELTGDELTCYESYLGGSTDWIPSGNTQFLPKVFSNITPRKELSQTRFKAKTRLMYFKKR